MDPVLIGGGIALVLLISGLTAIIVLARQLGNAKAEVRLYKVENKGLIKALNELGKAPPTADDPDYDEFFGM